MHIHSKTSKGIVLTAFVAITAFVLGAKFAPDEVINMCEGAVNEISKGWK